jgi:hypothetical protein
MCIGAENGDILRFHQFLLAYDQSEARMESQSEAIEEKVRKGGGEEGELADCGKTIVVRQNFTDLHMRKTGEHL